MTARPPLPPFTQSTAIEKVRLAEDGWNLREPEKWRWLIPSIAGLIALGLWPLCDLPSK